jgi:predicted MFS family arabinose efflux permease
MSVRDSLGGTDPHLMDHDPATRGEDRLVQQRQKAWAVMAAAFLASIAVAANRFKVPPVLPTIMSDLQVNMVTGGWLMSVYSVAGIILAIPAAYLMARWGAKRIGLVALGCSTAGSVLGALSFSAYGLLFSRTVEGIGMGLIAVVSPAIIARWFSPKERGLPIGIWATWVPIGSALMFNVAPWLAANQGWRSVWWFGVLLSLLAFIVYGLVVRNPPATSEAEPSPPRLFARALLNPFIWLLALAFAMFGFAMIGYNTWAPTYLSETLQFGAAAASFVASLMFLAGIPSTIIAGWMLDRPSFRKLLLPLAFLVTSILFLWSFRLPSPGAAVGFMIVVGLVSSAIPTFSFTFAPETMSSAEFAGLGLAVVTGVSAGGALLGPPVLASVLNGGDWAEAGTFLALVLGAGSLFSWIVVRRLGRA